MQKDNIVLQVSEETAGIMEAISEQLFEDTDARFDEVLEAIESTDEGLKNIGEKIVEKAKEIQKEIQTNQGDFNRKCEEVKTLISDFEKEFNAISKDSSACYKSTNDSINSLKGKLEVISIALSGIADCQNKMKENQENDKCLNLIKDISNELSLIKKNIHDDNEKMGTTLTKHTDVIDQTNKQLNKYGTEFTEHFGELSGDTKIIINLITKVSVSQEEIKTKQNEFEKKLDYLQLPFYKRWFKKGI